nr:ATP-binding protein [Motilibacter aurantiacus]
MPHRARAFACRACRAWGLPEPADAAGLVADELVANAVVHARTFVELHVSRRGEWLVVAVHDRDPAFRPSWWDCSAEDGHREPRGARYGLCIVRGTAAHVGAYPHRDGGKVVWAALPGGDQRAPAIDLTAPSLGDGAVVGTAVRRTLSVAGLGRTARGWRLELQLGWRAQDPDRADLTLRPTPAHPTLGQRHWQAPLELLAAGLTRPAAHDGLRVRPEPGGGVLLELGSGPGDSVRAAADRLREFVDAVDAVRSGAALHAPARR